VCNLLVIVTYFYKVFRQQRDIEEVPTTQILPPEMHEAEGTTVQPTLTPVATEENVTSIDLTEISGAYFTDSIPPSSSDGESYKTNSEADVTDH